ncbi:MAG: pyruvate kinase [Acidobacteria bacterium]|nr:pyruvate kinase [Acidobacteriota bacterium]
MRRAKIVATIGPASKSPEILQKLIQAGMDAARLNFSHGDYESHRQTIANIRKLSKALEKPVAILQDLQGPKIRTGQLENGTPVELIAGQHFVLTTNPVVGNKERVSTSYLALPQDLQPGNRILLSDGLIELKVLTTTSSGVECEVVAGGTLAENQGINLPKVDISVSSLTEKDIQDLEFGAEQEIDYLALSFIRKPQDILELKERLAEKNSDTPVIAKLEKPMAIENLDAIMDVCEGVMIARGDLGVEMAPEKVPVIQKHIIREANKKGKLVITATQMLESMIHNPRPTRAEASDVANAVLDGTDAVMLSGETAVGQYPVESVAMMANIIREAEKMGAESQPERFREPKTLAFPEAVCDAAYHASKSIQARAIVAFTQSGSTARLISKYRPSTEILGLTPSSGIVNRMALYWGVQPSSMQAISNVDELIEALEKLLLEQHQVRVGDNLIILTGAPIVEKGHTSLMKLHTVKQRKA